MRKLVEESEFLDINIESYIRLGSVLFTDENTVSADTGIWISVRGKEVVLLCHTEYLSTQLKHRFCREQSGKEEIPILAAVFKKSITVCD